jgi:hypothetical protein
MRLLRVSAAAGACLLAVVPVAYADAGADQRKVCKAAIAAIMGRDPAIISTKGPSGGIVHLEYIRPDDKTRWAYRCRLEGNRVLWASPTGRWMDKDMDGKVTYSAGAQGVTIHQSFSDGSNAPPVYFPASRL